MDEERLRHLFNPSVLQANAKPLGVGIIGAGPVTQAIHLPALSRLAGELVVTHIMDVDPSVAKSVAAHVGANHSSCIDGLLADPTVDIVAVCSPHQFHADQVIASCRAGKLAVLCEKPFAMDTTQAQAIARVSQATAVPIIVGAMHVFDPGWMAAQTLWADLPQTAHTIRSSITLPPNSRFEDFATEILQRPESIAVDFSDLKVVRNMLTDGVMGLAIHDLPLVRRFVPDFKDVQVLHARVVNPFGYVISLIAGEKHIELRAAMTKTWHPDWTFEAIADHISLKVDFTPSYVQAGSAVATVRSKDKTTTVGPFGYNGYEGEWRALASIARGETDLPSPQSLIDDLTFALDIAKGATKVVQVSVAKDPLVDSEQNGIKP